MGTFGQGKQDSKVPGACSRAASRLLLLKRSDLAGTDSQENSQRLKRTLKSRFKMKALFGLVRAML